MLFTHPEQSFYLRELARLTGTSAGTAQRELRGLGRVGLIRSHRRGRQIFYQANRLSPVFSALRTLLEQTMGAPDLLRAVEFSEVTDALAPMEKRLERPVNPTVYSPVEFQRRLKARRHFLTAVVGRPLIDLIGELPPDARPMAPERLAPGHTGVRRRRGRPKSG